MGEEEEEAEKEKKEEKEEKATCPGSCSSKAHSCWLVKGKNETHNGTGTCYVGTGRLSGNQKPMKQDQCEDHGDTWCPGEEARLKKEKEAAQKKKKAKAEKKKQKKEKKEGEEEEPSCPTSCSSNAHSCWIEKPGKDGKCYVGTGRLSGNKKPMTQDQCEDHGGSWCAKQKEKAAAEKKRRAKKQKEKEKEKKKAKKETEKEKEKKEKAKEKEKDKKE